MNLLLQSINRAKELCVVLQRLLHSTDDEPDDLEDLNDFEDNAIKTLTIELCAAVKKRQNLDLMLATLGAFGDDVSDLEVWLAKADVLGTQVRLNLDRELISKRLLEEHPGETSDEILNLCFVQLDPEWYFDMQFGEGTSASRTGALRPDQWEAGSKWELTRMGEVLRDSSGKGMRDANGDLICYDA